MVKSSRIMEKSSVLPYKKVTSEKNCGTSKKWIYVTAIIATYGFLKNISPESPYIAEFLVGERFNFTEEQVSQEIYPVSVYASVMQTIIVFFVTDILRYKPIIVVGALGFAGHKALLVWGRTLFQIQANQFFLGTARACALAYKTYIYTKVDREHYQRVTAIIRIAPKAGTLISSVLSQVALSVFLLNIDHLNRISLGASLMAVICAIILPSLKHSLYFNRNKTSSVPEKHKGCEYAVQLLWQDFKEAYTNPYIVKWCVWWVLATGGYQIVTDYYVQVLWSEISHERKNKYNAGIEAIYTVVSGISCFFVGGMKVNWRLRGDLVVGLCTLVNGLFLVWNATTQSILTSYIIYVVFGSLYDLIMVISNSEVAKHLKNESFALIFGINTFLAVSFQSLLTYFLVSRYVFALPIRELYIIIGCGFFIVGVAFIVKAIFNMLFRSKVSPEQILNTVASSVPVNKSSHPCHTTPSSNGATIKIP